MDIEPVTPDVDGQDDERYFAERWERWMKQLMRAVYERERLRHSSQEDPQ